MPWRSTRAMKSPGVYRASADLAKCGLRDTKFSAVVCRLVKLQRPPPEIRILRPIRGLCSSTTTRPPRLPASMAHISPAAPAPTTTASAVSRAIPLHSGRAARYAGLEMTRKVLLVTGDGGDSYEALYACQRFQEAHWEPVIAAPARRRLHMVYHDTEPGWDTYVERPGHSVDAHIAITAVSTKEFAAIVILGGRAPEYLRNDASLLELLRDFAAQNKCICAIGHGIQVLVAAGLVSGRTVTGHPHVCVEVERAGGIYSEKLAIRDGRMITAQSWKAHPEFYREVFAVLEAPK